MLARLDEVCARAFSAPEWQSAIDALREAAGVNVMVLGADRLASFGHNRRCAYCQVGGLEPGPAACLDGIASRDASRVVCSSGLAALISPITHEGAVVAYAVLTGFITSTRERRGLYERAVASGADSGTAQRSIRALPVLSRRQAEAYLQVVVSTATTVVDSTCERMRAADRVQELRLFVSAGQQVLSPERVDTDTLSTAASEAIAICGGTASAILRQVGERMETVATAGPWPNAVGRSFALAGSRVARMFEVRKPLMTHDREDRHILSLPLSVGARLVGVIEVEFHGEAPTVERLAQMGRFARFVAIALDRDDERRQIARAMRGYTELNTLAAQLGAQTSSANVMNVVLKALKRSVPFGVGGVLVTGWGRDSAVVMTTSAFSKSFVAEILRDVTGRDPLAKPFQTMSVKTIRGRDTASEDREWATSSAPLQVGDLTVGWLFAARADGHRYNAQDKALLEGLAAHAAAAFARAVAFERVSADYGAGIDAMSESVSQVRELLEPPVLLSFNDALQRIEAANAQLLSLDMTTEGYSA